MLRNIVNKSVKQLVFGLKTIQTKHRKHINSAQTVTRCHSSSSVVTQKVRKEVKHKAMSSEYVFTNDTPVVQLDAEIAFNGLTDEEKLYAHYLSKSCWFGSIVCLFQTSPESPLIFTLFRRLFAEQSVEELKALSQSVAQFDDNEWRALLVYLSAFLSNMGNYRSFGDSKFIPDLSANKMDAFVRNSAAFRNNQKELEFIWTNVKQRMFSLEKNELSLAFAPEGTTTYFSKNCTKEDSEIVKNFMQTINMDSYNCRVFKDNDKYEIRFASISSSEDPEDSDYLRPTAATDPKFVLTRGDYSPLLKIANKYLLKAKEFARNETESQMLDQYIRHFQSGDLRRHKDGSRFWIRDKKPIVETYIGFIENYRDPAGMRAEFEGFVSIVNKELSKKFESLVSNAPSFLPLLPWPKEFEKDRFLQPDFTSLDVLTFAGSGIPAGINIPNYSEIRQNEGFKNVSLGNVITAAFSDPKPNFLSADDAKLTEKYIIDSFEVQVGLHELLGHGSGKQLQIEDGKPNFDSEKTVNPLTGDKVDKWYKKGESYDSVFASLGSAYEECRAESVGLYLSLESEVLKIFGFSGADADHVVYVNWLSMVQKGILSLAMYNTTVGKWGQAHSRARYVITRVLLEASPDLVSIELVEKSPEDGNRDLSIRLNRELIASVGKKAIGDFLLKLQVYKSLGDIESAERMFDAYSRVSNDLEHPFLTYREVVLERKKPRKVYIQSSTDLSEGKVVAKKYASTHEALVQSFADHLRDNEFDLNAIVLDLWRKDFKHFY